MAATKMHGKAWTFGDIMDVDYEICPFHIRNVLNERGIENSPESLGKYCMSVVDPDFSSKVQKGDFIVAGQNFGYGHDHDHACISIKGAGVAAVLCESTNSNFFRNSLHHGLAVVECRGIREATTEGDEIKVDLAAGTIKNLTKGKEFNFVPFPPRLLAMIESDGVYPLLKKEVQAGKL